MRASYNCSFYMRLFKAARKPDLTELKHPYSFVRLIAAIFLFCFLSLMLVGDSFNHIAIAIIATVIAIQNLYIRISRVVLRRPNKSMHK